MRPAVKNIMISSDENALNGKKKYSVLNRHHNKPYYTIEKIGNQLRKEGKVFRLKN